MENISTNALEIHFINMVKYRKQRTGKLDNPLCRWLTWFDKSSSPDLIKEVVKMDTAIQTADDRMDHVTKNKEDMWAYTRYMMAECDRTSEINYALNKGREEERKMILELLNKGTSIDEIKLILSDKKSINSII